MKKIFTSLFLTVIFLGLILLGIYQSPKFHLTTQTQLLMDTFVTISVPGPKKIALAAINRVFARLKEIEVKFNSHNPQSPLYALNHQGKSISDPEILELIKVALEISRDSDGDFDITVFPLLELWGLYSGKSLSIPPEQKIKDCLKYVGYQHLLLKEGKLSKTHPQTKIDLGGIAKGYALKEAVKVLKTQGVNSALVDLGGDVYVLGKKDGRFWKVGIRNPRQEGLLGYVEVENLAVISSGDYERFFIREGKRYHHIFNPKTGYPTEGISGVTIIYAEPLLAQALTKVPFIRGAQEGLEFLEKIPGLEAMIITDTGQTLSTPQFKVLFKVFQK